MSPNTVAMRDALIDRIWQSMANNKKIFFVCADFGSPILDRIRNDFPNRFVNVGIAEQNLINVSAGLGLEGFTVFAYAIAPFITMRCYEQARVSLALMSKVRTMNVNLIGVGAGYSYVVSGPTHQCYEDITLMRAMPNFRVLSPSDHVASAALFDLCLANMGPKYLRLDAQVLPSIYQDATNAVFEGYYEIASGSDICFIATGYMVHTAKKVIQELSDLNLSIGLIDVIDLTGFDKPKFLKSLSKYSKFVSLEEGFKGRGGLDSMLFNLFVEESVNKPLLNIGVLGDYRFELGSRLDLHEQVGIGPEAVLAKVKNFLLN